MIKNTIKRSRCCQTVCPDCPWGYKGDSDIPYEIKNSLPGNREDEQLEHLQSMAEYYLSTQKQLDESKGPSAD